MKQRCNDTNCKEYPRYGAKGITVCSSWNKFENFFADMGERPHKNLTLERKNNLGNYNLSNCIWTTKQAQANNRRTNTQLEYHGVVKTLAQWCNIFELKHATVCMRLKRGWTINQALETLIWEKPI